MLLRNCTLKDAACAVSCKGSALPQLAVESCQGGLSSIAWQLWNSAATLLLLASAVATMLAADREAGKCLRVGVEVVT
jgi:hypothetical protein